MLPAGAVRAIHADSRLAGALRPLVTAALEDGEPVALPGRYRLRCADLPGALLLASIATTAGSKVCALPLSAGTDEARTTSHLRGARPDLPDRLPASGRAVILTDGAQSALSDAIACRPAGGLCL